MLYPLIFCVYSLHISPRTIFSSFSPVLDCTFLETSMYVSLVWVVLVQGIEKLQRVCFLDLLQ